MQKAATGCPEVIPRENEAFDTLNPSCQIFVTPVLVRLACTEVDARRGSKPAEYVDPRVNKR